MSVRSVTFLLMIDAIFLFLISVGGFAQAAERKVQVSDLAVRAFRDVCIATAPSFEGAAKKARAYGVFDMLPGIGGTTKDHSLSIQVKAGVECATTSPSRARGNVREQFLAVLKAATQSDNENFPFVGEVKGNNFVFHHDRKDGEAYVMLKR